MSGNNPIDDEAWPERLTGHVAEPGAQRIHGYHADADLARHYSFGAVILLAFTGELPEDAVARAFEIASIFLAPVPAGEGPAHAAILARLVGAAASAVIGTAAITLGEEARAIVRAHAQLLVWLASPSARRLPEQYVAHSPEDLARSRSLSQRLKEIAFRAPIFAAEETPQPTAAALGVLYACGLSDPERLESALVIARLPCTLAEGLATRPTHFKKYPMTLPQYVYRSGNEDE